MPISPLKLTLVRKTFTDHPSSKIFVTSVPISSGETVLILAFLFVCIFIHSKALEGTFHKENILNIDVHWHVKLENYWAVWVWVCLLVVSCTSKNHSARYTWKIITLSSWNRVAVEILLQFYVKFTFLAFNFNLTHRSYRKKKSCTTWPSEHFLVGELQA